MQPFHLLVSGKGQTPSTSDGVSEVVVTGWRLGPGTGGWWAKAQLGCKMNEYSGCHAQYVRPADTAGRDMGTLLSAKPELSSPGSLLFFAFCRICTR